MTQTPPRGRRCAVDPAWFLVPVLLLTFGAGVFLLAGILEQLPAASVPGR